MAASRQVLGDPSATLVLRDITVGNCRHCRELIAGSEEGIATSILASRARRRVHGAVPRPDPDLESQRRVVDAFFADSSS